MGRLGPDGQREKRTNNGNCPELREEKGGLPYRGGLKPTKNVTGRELSYFLKRECKG